MSAPRRTPDDADLCRRVDDSKGRVLDDECEMRKSRLTGVTWVPPSKHNNEQRQLSACLNPSRHSRVVQATKSEYTQYPGTADSKTGEEQSLLVRKVYYVFVCLFTKINIGSSAFQGTSKKNRQFWNRQ